MRERICLRFINEFFKSEMYVQNYDHFFKQRGKSSDGDVMNLETSDRLIQIYELIGDTPMEVY